MSTVTAQVALSSTEYERLQVIARQQKQTVEALVRNAVERVYLRPMPSQPVRFANLCAFGMWRDDSRTDEELLNALGGNWTDFPFHD